MGEKLPRGIRIHNRREKSLARKQGREPYLIQWKALPDIKEEAVILEPLKQTSLPSFLRNEPKLEIRSSFVETVVEKQIKRPGKNISIDEIMSSGMILSTLMSVNPNRETEYISNQDAEDLLERLEDGIRSGKVLSKSNISEQLSKLEHKIGPMGSVSTEIDLASWGVLNAIKENKTKLTK